MGLGKKLLQIILVVAIIVLAIAVVAIYLEESGYINKPVVPPRSEIPANALGVTLWSYADAANDLPPADFHYNVLKADIIVAATVTESNERWETRDGKEPNPSSVPNYDYHDYYYKECHLNINEVLLDELNVSKIFLMTNTKSPEFKVGDEYILFITRSENGNHLTTFQGYMIKNGTVYEGMNYQGLAPMFSITYSDLKNTIDNRDGLDSLDTITL